MHDWQLLVVLAPAGLKDAIVDLLIGEAGISGFTLTRAHGFSAEHSHFNLREQVEGYRDFFQVEVLHRRAQQEQLLAALQPVCAPAAMRYWITPVSGQGHFGDAPATPDSSAD